MEEEEYYKMRHENYMRHLENGDYEKNPDLEDLYNNYYI